MIIGLEDDLQEIAAAAVRDASASLMDDLIEAAPVETGELVASAYGPIVDEVDLTATVGFDAEQADFTNEGTPPHAIDGNPNMTFFWADGPNGPGVYTFTHVDHPGSPATHWFDDVVDDWDDYVQAALDAT